MNARWTVGDVAARLDVEPSTVRAFMARNQMPEPTDRLGRTPWWSSEDIEPWMGSHLRARAAREFSRHAGQGWEVRKDEPNQWEPDPMPYLMADELGEAGLIAYDLERGGYFLPGQREDRQGPFRTIDEAIRAAEAGNPWGDA